MNALMLVCLLISSTIKGSLWQKCKCYLCSLSLTRVISGLLPGSKASLGGNNDSRAFQPVSQSWPCISIRDALVLQKTQVRQKKKVTVREKETLMLKDIKPFSEYVSWEVHTKHTLNGYTMPIFFLRVFVSCNEMFLRVNSDPKFQNELLLASSYKSQKSCIM